MPRALLLLGLVACATSDAGNADDVDTDAGPAPAPLATPTGACPDLSAPGLKTFTSAGIERRVGIYFPEDPPEDLPVIFSFHGLTTPDQDVIPQLVSGFDLDGLASEQPAIVVVPQARATNLVVAEVLLWGILSDEARAEDLALYDDLRTCLAQELGADMRRVSAWGHSGGALWTSVLLTERSTTLATVVSASGGTGSFPAPGYLTPERDVPALLIDGGSGDAWPDATFPVIQFQDTTATFRDALVADGHPVVWCEHDLGHFTLPSWFWRTTTTWLKRHRYGQPSPWFEGEPELPAACEKLGG